jgi:DNA-binding NarL/FixJ family response regulator
MIRVAIADDHRIVREGLMTLLASEDNIEIVGEAADGAGILAIIAADPPDVLILDMRMPGTSGFDVLKALRDEPDSPHVIALSMHDDPAYVKRAVELGASGYLLKTAGREELLRALDVVSRGGSYIQGEVTAPLVADLLSGEQGSVGELSTKDITALELLAAGYDNRQIATALGVSEAAVKSQLRSIYSVLRVKRRSEAVAVALRLGLIV